MPLAWLLWGQQWLYSYSQGVQISYLKHILLKGLPSAPPALMVMRTRTARLLFIFQKLWLLTLLGPQPRTHTEQTVPSHLWSYKESQPFRSDCSYSSLNEPLAKKKNNFKGKASPQLKNTLEKAKLSLKTMPYMLKRKYQLYFCIIISIIFAIVIQLKL